MDHLEYVPSGRKLSKKMLQTLGKYFKSIFLPSLSNGSIQRKYNKQLCSAAKCKLHHELQEHYREKLKRLLESQEHHYSCTWHCKRGSRSTCNGRSTHNGNCCHFKPCGSGYKDSCSDHKAPPEDGKFNKPCHLHGVNSKHSYDECLQNPKNQASTNNNNSCIQKMRPQRALP